MEVSAPANAHRRLQRHGSRWLHQDADEHQRIDSVRLSTWYFACTIDRLPGDFAHPTITQITHHQIQLLSQLGCQLRKKNQQFGLGRISQPLFYTILLFCFNQVLTEPVLRALI